MSRTQGLARTLRNHPTTDAKARADNFAARILATWQRAVGSIIETGKLLIAAKKALPHGQFTAMIEAELPFTPRTAQILMKIAEHPVIGNPKFISSLPPSWGTLHVLIQLETWPHAPENLLKQLIDEGQVSSKTTHADVTYIRQKLQETGPHIAENAIYKTVCEAKAHISFRVRDALNDLMGAMRQWPDANAPYIGNSIDWDNLPNLARWVAKLYATRTREPVDA